MPTITRRSLSPTPKTSLTPTTTATTTAPAPAPTPAAGAAETARRVDPRVLGGPVRGGDSSFRVTGTPLAQGVTLSGGRLMVDGFAAASRAVLKRSGGHLLVSAATRACAAGTIAKLSASARAQLVDELTPLVQMPSIGRASRHDVSTRSGAFSLLEACLLAMKTRGEQRAATTLAAVLVAAVGAEQHPGLRAHMERRLGLLPDRCVPTDLAAAVETMRAHQAHERPLRDAWMKGTPPTLKVLASVQDEFWKDQIASFKARGYEVSMTSDSKAVARRTVTDVTPNATIEVDLRLRDTDVFDGIDDRDVDVVLYTGHAQLGGIAKLGLEHGPRAANGEKVVALFSCRSKQNIDAVERRYPGQHLLVSAEGTYGHDDEIVMHHLLDGIVKNKTYAQMEMAAKRDDLWESKNYYFPNETAALVGNAPVYVPTSTTGIGTSISMRARASAPLASSVPPGAVTDAVAWLNTIQGYWAETSGTRADKALHDQFVSKGWFDATPGDPLVKVAFVGGKAEISVSSALATQDPDALAMVVTFLAGQALAKHGDPKRSPHDQRMLGLAMVSSYVYFMIEYSDTADVLLRQFAKTFGFPPGLSWPVVEKAVSCDADNDCSAKSIKMLERGMEHVFLEVNAARTSSKFRRYIGGALEELKKNGSPIAKLTHELISSGQVQIDELSDLTRADYLRVRNEMLKTGVTIPASRDALDDKRGKAWRAITTDMNGYMWDNRIYVAPGQSARDLAATLVHEVNHVRNKSEESYRSHEAIFVEEYRAFYSEALFRGEKLTPARCKEIKEGVIRDYQLKGVTADNIADRPPGLLE